MSDTQPPRRVLKPKTEQDAPDNLPNSGLTPSHGILNPHEAIPYIRRKVAEGVKVALEQAKELDVEETRDANKSSTRKSLASGGLIGLLTLFGGLCLDYKHEARMSEVKTAQQQKIDDLEALVNKLLDFELKHKGDAPKEDKK
jgi:hypothetical protein